MLVEVVVVQDSLVDLVHLVELVVLEMEEI